MSDQDRPSNGIPGRPLPENRPAETPEPAAGPAHAAGGDHAAPPSPGAGAVGSHSAHHPEPAHGDSGHGAAVAVADDPFADPGLPAHRPRRTDIDTRAAKRAERQVAILFMTSVVATIAFVVAYVAFPHADKTVNVFPIGPTSISNLTLGLALGVSMFCIGAGAIHWARTLMTDEEMIQERHPMRSSDEDRAEAIAQLQAGVDDSGIARHPLIRRTLLAALGALPLLLIAMRDLGPLPYKKLRKTAWAKDKKLINENTGQPIRPEDILIGSLTSARPEGLDQHQENFLNEMAKAAVLLIRIAPEEIRSKKSRDNGYQGILCYSKICSHVGCPLGLYEQQTHHMLCPCHQSTFDMADGARVVFGPAARNLPQLAIEVNEEGYLVARGDFDEPVGPSFWERG